MPDFYETALGWSTAVQDHYTALANSVVVITGTTFFPPATPVGTGALEKYTQRFDRVLGTPSNGN